MRAVVYPGSQQILIEERPTPVPSATGILVRVEAAGLNRADLMQRAGRYPVPAGWPTDIPGLEYAGVITELGHGVTHWRVGDRVMGLVGGGAHADYVTVDQREAIAIPATLSMVEAAAVPEAFLTGWDALVHRGRLLAGERVLIHAIGSGVGTATCQLARLLGATVIGSSRSAEKLARCEALGMHHGVLTADPQWPDAVGGPVDLVVDMLGKAVFEQSLALLASRGRLVALGTLTGATDIALDLRMILSKRLEIVGSVMRSRALAERSRLVEAFTREILPAIAAGALKPIVDRTFPLGEIDAAHQLMASNETFGKVILTNRE